jgi:hypothetical protein
MGTLWQDIKYGFRMLARSPRFTVFVVVLLAIGVGTTTAMLSVVDAVMLRSRAPYKDPETLVCVYETDSYVHPVTGVAGRYMMNYTSLTSFRDWRQRSHVFTSLVGAHQSDDTVVHHAGKKEKTRALYRADPGTNLCPGRRKTRGRAGGDPELHALAALVRRRPECHRQDSDR